MSTEAKPLTTMEVANRLIELCRLGKITEAQQELFADDIACNEPEHAQGMMPSTTSKQAAIAKGEQFSGSIEALHEQYISEPVVAGNWFSFAWTMDVTLKGMGRRKMEEVLVCHVENGQIVSEQYFF